VAPRKVYTDTTFEQQFPDAVRISIAELKHAFGPISNTGVNSGWNNTKYMLIGEDIFEGYDVYIKGKVISNDEQGNVYKSLYIQDETAGIEIKIGKNGLYNEYKLGQWIYVDCDGLTIGDYNGMINIGYADPTGEYETGYLEHSYIIDLHVFKGEYADPVEPVVIKEADLHKKVNLGRLVTIEDLKYDNHVFILAYVNPNGNRKDYTNNCIFIDEEGPNNYGVTTWACSETKWKEYLNAGNFDCVEAAGTTVGVLRNSTGIGSEAYSVSQYFKMGSTDVQVRSSGYSRFADTEIPEKILTGEATVSFTGILTEYKGAAQFTLIDLNGVKKADGTGWYK
jgi:hypothetical protein